jgi:hypothetical protein
MYRCSQSFTADKHWDRLDIKIDSAMCTKPAPFILSIYGSFTETSIGGEVVLSVNTPIYRTELIIPPGLAATWISAVMKPAAPGYYCWEMDSLTEDPMSLVKVKHVKTPTYSRGYAYLNNIRQGDYVYISNIIEPHPNIERYLIRRGAVDSSGRFRAGSKDTNLVAIDS